MNDVCSDVVNESDSEIINYLYTTAYESIETTSMENSDWEEAQIQAELISEIAKNKSSVKWFKLVDDYYITQLPLRQADLEATIDNKTITLKDMHKARKMAEHEEEMATA